MRTYNVYRVDYKSQLTEPIGKVVERRREERDNNAADLLRVAQMKFRTSSIDSHIFIMDAAVPLAR